MNTLPKVECIGNAAGKTTQGRSVYSPFGLCPTLTAGMTHGNTVPYIVEITEIRNERSTDDRSDG
jgi:hypothetical protein